MIIGLTGGIGSGKSTVAKIFNILGVPVYNSDARAKELYFIPEIKTAVVKLLGDSVYTNTGIDSKLIASKIFSDRTILNRLNSIIHPAVANDFANYVSKNSAASILIKESALLFETGLYKKLDKTILVTASENTRIERIIQRDQISMEEVKKRMSNQMQDHQTIPLADFVIINDNSKAIIPQVVEIYNQLISA